MGNPMAMVSMFRRDFLHSRTLTMRRAVLASLVAAAALAPTAHADPGPDTMANDGVVTPVFSQPTNVPGKSMVAVTVQYPPGGGTPAHHHAPSAFIMGYVISGQIRSQTEGEPEQVYHAGQTWSEEPGAHHTISENASTTEPAEFLAVFLVDIGTAAEALTTVDN
jgi:quercetin dioxygenase-like cupin family protein